MPRFAANLTMLFTEVPFLDRFERAARAGFKAVEFLFPYAWPASEIRQRLDAHKLQLVLHNLPAGNWDAGERGIACHPDRVEEFRAGVAQAITYASALGVPQLNCLAGKVPANVDAAALAEMIRAGGGKATLKTVEGQPLTVSMRGSDIVVSDAKGDVATVTTSDVYQSNGVIHVVDHVLLPG